MDFMPHIFFIIVVGQLNTFNTPPVAGAGQQQVQALSPMCIYMLAQRIVQMTQVFGTEKLTNGNGINFWDQFLTTALLIASCNKVHVYFKNKILVNYNETKSRICNVIN